MDNKNIVIPAGDSYQIPNYSGDHSAGHTGTPISSRDLANKAYVDAQIAGENHWDDTGTYLTPFLAGRGMVCDGNVGIGTTNPSVELDVVGKIKATSSSFPIGHFRRDTAVTGGSLDGINGIASGYLLQTQTTGNMADGFGGGLLFGNGDNTIDGSTNFISRIYARRDGADNQGALQFFTSSQGTAPTMTLRSFGNVGIGTSSPDEKLHVVGNSHVTGNSTVDGVRNQKYYIDAYIAEPVTGDILNADEWHSVRNLTVGESEGITKEDGTAGAITSIAQNSSDITLTATNTLAVGDSIALLGSTGYDGLYLVTAATATTFDVTATFVATGTGVYVRGDTFEAPVDGIYSLYGNASSSSDSANIIMEFDFAINAIPVQKGSAIRKFGTAGDVGNLSSHTLVNLTAGDKITFVLKNKTNTADLTTQSGSIIIKRI